MAGMVSDGITIKFSANTSGLTDGAKQAQDVIGGFAKVAGVALLATGAAALAAGVASTKMAADFQASMIKSQAEAGLTKQQMTEMGNAILDMAPKVGQAPKDLADGLFFVESAGFAGKDALDTLRLSAQMAANDMTDTATVTKGLTTAVKAFGYQTSDSAMVANQMTVTVSNGKLTMEQYANSIGKLALTAHGFKDAFGNAKISMAETNAALDTLTNRGFPSAALASTALTNVLQQFEGNTDKVTKNIHALGIAFDENKFKSLDLKGQIEYLTATMKGHESQLQHVLGGSKSAAQGFQALAGDTAGYQSILEKLNNAQKNGGAEAQAFAATQQGFNFQMQQAQATVEVLGIKLGTALLPKVGELLSKIMPIITQFGNWLVSSHFLENAFDALSNALVGVVSVVTTVVDFFQKNHAALVILQASLGPIIGIIGGALVFAFVAWATAAWGAAVATLAATWPFLLIGALIGAVVVGIILAIQHWGAITKWFQGIWGAVSNWFMGIVKAVGSFFMGIWSALAAWFTGMWTGIITGLTAAWNFILNVVRAAGALLLVIVLGPIIAIANGFIWLYNHNTYFKMLVDAIVNFFKGCFAWLQGAWTDVVNWLGGVWNGLVGFAAMLWGQIAGAIQNGFIIAVDFVIDVWNTISTVFSNAWNTYIAQPLAAMWSAVSTFFSGIWTNYIAGPIGALWNSISGAIGGWVTKAVDWGANLIQGFVNGIISKANSVAGAVGGIAGQVLAFLGFHSPTKEGPGREADVWAPNFVKMYAKGLTNGLPEIQNAVNKLSTPLALNFNSKFQYPTAAATSSPQIVVHVHNAPPDIYMDADKVTEHVAKKMASKIRLKGDVRAR